MTGSEWARSQLLGRELEPAELDGSGAYMTIHIGGPLNADVLLTADVEHRRVSVSARWSAAGSTRELRAEGLTMADAETRAAQWADSLSAGREPDAATPPSPGQRPDRGTPAPDFELDGSEGPFRLSDHRGERVVLFFYPGDNNLICTRQFCSYRDRVDEFSDLGVLAVGISPQSVDSHREFIAEHALTLPLLADTELAVSRAYDVHSRLIGTKRATFIIDETGIIRYRHDHRLSLSYDTVPTIADALAQLG